MAQCALLVPVDALYFSVIFWDERKRAANRRKHGLDFTDAERFDLKGCQSWIDDRELYGEEREVAVGWFDGRLCALVYVDHGERGLRLISFRPATKEEGRRYAATI